MPLGKQSIEARKQHAISVHSVQAAQFAERYGVANQDVYNSCFTYSRKRLDSLIAQYLPERGGGLRLLDVGCGTGHHLARLRERGFDVAGVDGSAEMLVHAKANNPGSDIRHADVEALPFPDASFDFVTCIEVLRYLPRTSSCIREMARVLKPGGCCLATATPWLNLNGYWLINRLAVLFPIGNLTRLRQYFLSSRRLRREFVAAGFAASRVHGVYIGPINWAQRLAPKALPVLLRAWEPIDARAADVPLVKEFSNMFLVHALRTLSPN